MKKQRATLTDALIQGGILFLLVLGLSTACIWLNISLHTSYPQWVANLDADLEASSTGEVRAESAIYADGNFYYKEEGKEEISVISANDRLIRKGEAVHKGETLYNKLTAYRKHCDERQEKRNQQLLHSVILMAVLLIVFSICLAMLRESIMLSFSNQILCAICVVLHVSAIVLGLYVFEKLEIFQNLYLVALLPTSMAPALMSNLLGRRVGICAALMLSALTVLLTGFGESFLFFLQCLICSTISVVAFQNVHSRKNFHWGAVGLFVIIVISVAFLLWYRDLTWAWKEFQPFWSHLFLYAFLHVVFVLLAVLLFPSIFERFFDVTTTFTLNELLARDHKLLVRLREEASGTYEHSLAVATIASDAARAIHVNDKLTEVCSYFHDIGKLFDPKVFAENLTANEPNPHDSLPPQESCKLLRRHTEYGLQLTKDAHLPRAIQEACASHHGNGLMSGFYAKAQKLAEEKGDPPPQEQDFHYDAKLPSRPEVVLIEMADCSEAASHAWVHRWTKENRPITAELLRESVERLMFEKIQDHQFDDAELTMADFRIAIDAIVHSLCNINHIRPEYQKPKPAEETPGATGAEAPSDAG